VTPRVLRDLILEVVLLKKEKVSLETMIGIANSGLDDEIEWIGEPWDGLLLFRFPSIVHRRHSISRGLLVLGHWYSAHRRRVVFTYLYIRRVVK